MIGPHVIQPENLVFGSSAQYGNFRRYILEYYKDGATKRLFGTYCTILLVLKKTAGLPA
jgi:hypothetical protein